MIAETIFIEQTIDKVFDAFANLSNWQKVLPDVLDVQTIYDDGYHQEFLMTVDRPNGAETIRGIRFCCPNARIELFQPVPPPGFKSMTGCWTFEEHQGVVQVTAQRWFELLLPDTTTKDEDKATAYQDVETKLRGYLHHNLGLFKTSLEGVR